MNGHNESLLGQLMQAGIELIKKVTEIADLFKKQVEKNLAEEDDENGDS